MDVSEAGCAAVKHIGRLLSEPQAREILCTAAGPYLTPIGPKAELNRAEFMLRVERIAFRKNEISERVDVPKGGESECST